MVAWPSTLKGELQGKTAALNEASRLARAALCSVGAGGGPAQRSRCSEANMPSIEALSFVIVSSSGCWPLLVDVALCCCG